MKKVLLIAATIIMLSVNILAEESDGINKEKIDIKTDQPAEKKDSYLNDLFGEKVEEPAKDEKKGAVSAAIIESAGGNEIHGGVAQAIEITRFNDVGNVKTDRVTLTLAEGELNRKSWGDWKIWYKVSESYEVKIDNRTSEDPIVKNSQTRFELNPRWEVGYGNGIYGTEFGYYSDTNNTNLKIRPFMTYKPVDTIELSLSSAITYKNNFAGNDTAEINLEPGYSQEITALGPMSRLWINPLLIYNVSYDDAKTQVGENKGKISEEFYLFCLRLHYWKGFSGGLGINLLGEFLGYTHSNRKIDNSTKEEVFSKYIMTVTKELGDSVLFAEASYRPIDWKDTNSTAAEKVKSVSEVLFKVGLHRSF